MNRVKHLSNPEKTATHQSITPAKQVKTQVAYQVDGKITSQHSIIPGNLIQGKAVKMGGIDVRDKGDNIKCHITGIAVLPSGELIMCDFNNSKIKMTDTSTTTVNSSIQLPSTSCDVTVIDTTEAVVTLPYKQQFQYVKIKPRLCISRTVNLQRKCYGVDVNNQQILVASDKQGGDILMLSLDGIIQRTVRTCNQKCNPGYLSHYISVCSSGKNVLVYTGDLTLYLNIILKMAV